LADDIIFCSILLGAEMGDMLISEELQFI